jgi:hypothetical protein
MDNTDAISARYVYAAMQHRINPGLAFIQGA